MVINASNASMIALAHPLSAYVRRVLAQSYKVNCKK